MPEIDGFGYTGVRVDRSVSVQARFIAWLRRPPVLRRVFLPTSPRGMLEAVEGTLQNFLAIARGSLMETETFLMIAIRLGYWQQSSASPTLDLITELARC